MPVCEAAGAWAVRVAAGEQRQRFFDASTALNVVRRHRLAAARAHLATAVVGVTREVLSTTFLQVLALEKRIFMRYSAHGCARASRSERAFPGCSASAASQAA